MLDVFGSLKTLVRRRSGPTIDNAVFRLHYKFTATIIITLSIAISARQYIGDPIDCMGEASTLPNHAKMVDELCWIQGTFTIPDYLEEEVGSETGVPAPGIGKLHKGMEKTVHGYYYWVGFILVFQGACFYLPHYIWKSVEGGKIKALMLDLLNPVSSEEERAKNIDIVVAYCKRNQNNHKLYTLQFVICEVLNFINVIMQIILTDKFLGGEFSTYGWDVLRFMNMDPAIRVDPMVRVFPKVTKCLYHHYGSGGGVQTQDFFCILPVNILNEKIYIFLWFWFVILAILSGMQMLYRVLTIFIPRIRLIALRKRAHLVPSEYVDSLLRSGRLGDWFLIYQLSKNMDQLAYREFLTSLAASLESPEHKKLNEYEP